MAPNKALLTGGYVRCAHPPVAEAQGVRRPDTDGPPARPLA